MQNVTWVLNSVFLEINFLNDGIQEKCAQQAVPHNPLTAWLISVVVDQGVPYLGIPDM